MANWHFVPLIEGEGKYVIDNYSSKNLNKILKKLAPIAIKTAKEREIKNVYIEIPNVLTFPVFADDNKKEIADEIFNQYLQNANSKENIDIDENINEQVKTRIKQLSDFKSVDEFAQEMAKIQPINVFSKDLNIQQATKWATEIMYNLIRCQDIIKNISDEDRKKFADALENAGAIKTSQIKDVSLDIAENDGKNSSNCPNNIYFPLCIFGQAFNSKSNFDFWMNECILGKENSWGAQWITTQENFNNHIKMDIDKENE